MQLWTRLLLQRHNSGRRLGQGMARLLALPLAAVLVLGWGAASARACGVSAGGGIIRASFAAGTPDAVRLTFVGHATFLLETPQGVRAATDYNGVVLPDGVPDLVTMNHAHMTHYTDRPDPRIAHVLRGWREDGAPARIDMRVGDLRVWNLPTSTRGWGEGEKTYGNSVFVFESAGLCIAHLSHLHHVLTEDDLAVLGPIDVVLAPVDGVWTLDLAGMAEVLDRLHPRLVIPMHYYGNSVLERFLAQERDRYAVRRAGDVTTILSRATLPDTPQILVLEAQQRY
jgi:L-ascorbate metabolism protein UlaG (beta-lactamase superfamily)